MNDDKSCNNNCVDPCTPAQSCEEVLLIYHEDSAVWDMDVLRTKFESIVTRFFCNGIIKKYETLYDFMFFSRRVATPSELALAVAYLYTIPSSDAVKLVQSSPCFKKMKNMSFDVLRRLEFGIY